MSKLIYIFHHPNMTIYLANRAQFGVSNFAVFGPNGRCYDTSQVHNLCAQIIVTMWIFCNESTHSHPIPWWFNENIFHSFMFLVLCVFFAWHRIYILFNLLMLSWVNAVSIVVVMKRIPTNILIPASILVVYFRFWLNEKKKKFWCFLKWG